MKLKIIFLIFPACLYAHAVMSQIEHQVKTLDKNNKAQPIEEITVIGQRSFANLRIRIDKAEDRIFELFNKLNTDDLYDIHCSKRAPTGSHIIFKTCAPVYYNKTVTEATQRALSGEPVGTSYINAKLSHYNPILGEKWKHFVNENPALLEAVRKHYKLREELKRQRRAYFGLDD